MDLGYRCHRFDDREALSASAPLLVGRADRSLAGMDTIGIKLIGEYAGK